jgi:SAM-dependent methyltransferase
MVIDFRDNFLTYIEPLDESFFPGKIGLDLGCGFGRHIYNAAKFGAEMIGVDLSDAIESTRANTQGLPNVHLVQADVYHLPIRHGALDFAYSIGVLHHTPDPEAAFRCLVPLVKPGGSVFVWVYSKSRSFLNFCLESVRALTTHLPPRAQKVISLGAAVVDYGGFVAPYKIASSTPGLRRVVAKLPMTSRLKLYSVYPFQVVYADWFDRLAAPIRFYYDGDDMKGWLSRARLSQQRISPTGLFGWRAYGERT